jgi:hypothetical protein
MACFTHMYGLLHAHSNSFITWTSPFLAIAALSLKDLRINWQNKPLQRSDLEEGDSFRASGKTQKSTLSEIEFRSRLLFGISVASSFRFIGTTEEVKSVPYFSKKDPTYVPDRGAFILRAALTAIFCYLVLDLMTMGPHSSGSNLYLIPEKISLFVHLASISIEEMKYRLFATIGLWTNPYRL